MIYEYETLIILGMTVFYAMAVWYTNKRIKEINVVVISRKEQEEEVKMVKNEQSEDELQEEFEIKSDLIVSEKDKSKQFTNKEEENKLPRFIKILCCPTITILDYVLPM